MHIVAPWNQIGGRHRQRNPSSLTYVSTETRTGLYPPKLHISRTACCSSDPHELEAHDHAPSQVLLVSNPTPLKSLIHHHPSSLHSLLPSILSCPNRSLCERATLPRSSLSHPESLLDSSFPSLSSFMSCLLVNLHSLYVRTVVFVFVRCERCQERRVSESRVECAAWLPERAGVAGRKSVSFAPCGGLCVSLRQPGNSAILLIVFLQRALGSVHHFAVSRPSI